MRILFISEDLAGVGLAHKMLKEGNEVKLYINNKTSRACFDNLLQKVTNWRKELDWVGKDGLIVFDDVGYGKIQDSLRKKGYKVFGGSKIGDELEEDRYFAHKVFQEYGLKTVELVDFANVEEAILYVMKNPKAWVVKQNGSTSKTINYVGHFSDGRDVISILKNYLHNKNINREKITLQEKIKGVEIGVGRYFNGNDWVGPIEMNIEHKKLFPGDAGPMTTEMGTLAWYDADDSNKLFQETIAKLKPFLQKINFKGDFEINCIVNENGAFPLEATPRFGSPIIDLHVELHESPWSEFLMAIARGEKYDLNWKKGYGIVNLIAIPPFPYAGKKPKPKDDYMHGVNVYFDGLSKEELEHVHFEEVSKRCDNVEACYIAGHQGYVLYVTNVADTVSEARIKVLNTIDHIIIPKMVYRNDIGKKFEDSDEARLKSWGYLK